MTKPDLRLAMLPMKVQSGFELVTHISICIILNYCGDDALLRPVYSRLTDLASCERRHHDFRKVLYIPLCNIKYRQNYASQH